MFFLKRPPKMSEVEGYVQRGMARDRGVIEGDSGMEVEGFRWLWRFWDQTRPESEQTWQRRGPSSELRKLVLPRYGFEGSPKAPQGWAPGAARARSWAPGVVFLHLVCYLGRVWGGSFHGESYMCPWTNVTTQHLPS